MGGPFDGDCCTTEVSPTKRSAALFLMKAKNEGRLTQSALNSVVHSTSDLCHQVVHRLKRKFSEAIEESTITEADKRSLVEKMSSIEYEPFEGITTEYQQGKFYKENFDYLVCMYVHAGIQHVYSHAS